MGGAVPKYPVPAIRWDLLALLLPKTSKQTNDGLGTEFACANPGRTPGPLPWLPIETEGATEIVFTLFFFEDRRAIPPLPGFFPAIILAAELITVCVKANPGLSALDASSTLIARLSAHSSVYSMQRDFLHLQPRFRRVERKRRRA